MAKVVTKPRRGRQLKWRVLPIRHGALRIAQNTPAYPGIGQWLLLTADAVPIAWIELQDKLRPHAKATIQQLVHAGVACEIVSGDRAENVAQLAEQLGVSPFKAAATPNDKLTLLRQRQEAHQVVMMIGDGINDVPVLAGADISLAMGRASTLAQTQAQAVLIQNDLSLIHYLFRYSARNA